MDAGSELRRLVAEELCEIMEGWTQCDAASLLGLRLTAMERPIGKPRAQPEVRVLRFDIHGMPARRGTGGGQRHRRSGGWNASDAISGI